MTPFDLQKTREQYLERLLTRYGTVTLPIDSARLALPLHTVFQPMVLRRDPLASQDGRSVEPSEIVKARDGAEALTKSAYRRMVVLGSPGMGKTTALKALLYTAITTAQIDPSAPLPLFISLPDLMRAKLSFEEYIQHVITELDIDPRFANILTVAVHNGNAFLCLDSLDEVLPASRPEVIAFLNEGALRCGGTWIIGSRFTEYKGGQFAHSQFAEWELQVLGEQERLALARQLLSALYNVLYGDLAKNLKPAMPSAEAYIQALQQSTQIATWGENPLLLSLAAVLYVQTGRLPASRAILYAQVTEAMFTMRIHDATQRAELRHLLAELALEFYQTRGRNFSITDALEMLPSLLSDQSTPSLSAALTRILDSGVLEPVAYQTYGFKHQMFQEYLAAVALARRCIDETQRQSTWNLLWRKRRLSRWHEILRLFVGILVHEYGAEGLQITREWLSTLAMEYSTSEGDPGNLCLILAMQSLGEFGERVSETEVADLAQHIVEIWAQTFHEYVPTEPILKLLEDEEIINSYRSTYWELIQLLQLQGVEISPELLLPVLKHYSPKTEIAPIIASLCRAGTQAPIEPLLRLIYEETRRATFRHPKWIQQLFYILYEWVSPEHLTNALANTPNDQWLAVSLLGLVHDDESIQLLTAVAQDPTRDRTTRSEAMVVLSDLGVNLPLEYLLQATRWCTYEGMGGYLADTVERLGEQTPIEQLLPLLGEDHNRLQPGVVEALVRIAKYIPLETVLPLLEDNNELVRNAAIRILGTMGERTPLDVLAALLGDPEQTLETRTTVLSALGELGTPAAVDLLLEALEDDEAEIRGRALWALKDDESETRRGGLRAFKEQGKEIPLEPLLKLLNDPDDYVVESSLAVLGELGSLGVAVPVEPLIFLLDHEDESVAEDAAEALCKFGERAPIDTLLTHMYDKSNRQIREGIFHALSTLETHILPLEAMLTALLDNNTDSWRIKFALRYYLTKSMPEQILERLHDDLRPSMRRTVLQAIQTTKGCEWLPLVLTTLHDVDGQYAAHDQDRHGKGDTIRSDAVKALGALSACAPIEPLLQLLYTTRETYNYDDERIVVLEALRQFGARVPPTALWPLLGSNHTQICRLAFQHLQETHPAALKELVPMLKAIVSREPVQGAFAARMSYRIAETVALMGRATPAVLEMVTDLLDHPFWEVRVRAAQTLGTLRRNIPDSAIRRLLELRKDPESPDVRASADQALAEILSLEQGMEDE